MEWRVWLFFLPKTPLFHSSNTVLAVSSLTHNHLLPSFSGDSMDGKANTSVMSGVVLGSTWWWVFGWCWWATMSHFTTTAPTMCTFLLFTSSACSIPLSLQPNISLTDTSPYMLSIHIHTTHKWHLCDGLSSCVLSHKTNEICHPLLSNTATTSLLPPLTSVALKKQTL